MRIKRKMTIVAAVIGSVVVTLILVFGTLWMGQSARRDTETAVRSVSLLYLDELAGRREQVVAENLKDRIKDMQTALDLMTAEDLSDDAHLRDYQSKMKQYFTLERFAFVDEHGTIYTSTGTQDDIGDYGFDYRTISEPEISILNLTSPNKKVIIALPTDIVFQDRHLVAAFMQIAMQNMLNGVSMQAESGGTTFSNLYTNTGVALTNTVLGGLAMEDNLLEALKTAVYEPGYSFDKVASDFASVSRGVVSFSYKGIRETLSYVPVEGTDWMLTYLIRENVLTTQIGSISDGIIRRSVLQSILTVAALILMFVLIITEIRRNAQLMLEKETSNAENRVKREELEQRLALQDQLLKEQEQKQQQNSLITALSSDYWSVYYIDLETYTGICYQQHADLDDGVKVGESFDYLEVLTAYAQKYVKEQYREEFLRFIQPESIQAGLRNGRVLSYTYMVSRHDRDAYEMIRLAGVRQPGSTESDRVHSVGVCFTDVDEETRKQYMQQQTLSDALAAAEQANKAKTTFLSNMSHEIRTPMNAIIGLDSIALADPSLSEETREHLEKIGTSAHHLLGIINDILDMSRIESGRMVIKNEEFSFAAALAQVNTIISGQCREKGLHYECRIIGHVRDYYIGDDMKLRQVMINILGNAVKFTPEGGTVTFIVEEAAHLDNKSTLRFTVTDTGIGISEEYLPRIFDAFSQEDTSATNRYGSTGLGLPITKSIVELMNGTITVQSEKGKGSTFVVTVTLADSDRKDDSRMHDLIQPRDMCVLVIDDDPIACEHAQLVLGQVGILCEKALSGAEAINMVQVRHARREPYNLILVDWKMPDMDGIETTRRIRAIVGNVTPIIILTSYSWDDIIDEAKEAGVDTFVSKPLFAGAVMDEFREAFSLKNPQLERETVDLAGKRVLLAEDVSVNAEIMMMVLSMRDMQVEHAENGRIAVDMFAQHEAGYYDAILMDMRMPEMDGLEATRTIRAMDRPDARTVPIIALTANAFDEDVQRSMQAGLNAHLSKPVEPDVLFRTLEGLIR